MGASGSFSDWAKNIGNGNFVNGSPYHKSSYEYDIAGTLGSPVAAFTGGTIISVLDPSQSEGYGNTILIQDNSGNIHKYSHLNSMNVNEGDPISAGTIIGQMGNTGTVLKIDGTEPTAEELAEGRGTHLHYSITDQNGAFVDPGSIQTPSEISENDIYDVMKNSEGGAKATQAFKKGFEKASLVVDQLSALTDLMVTEDTITNQETGFTWDIAPLSGWLAEKNPWDSDAQTIQAILISTVPNLARGIYGEVGVLTDNDVALYKKTLPNLKQTDQVKQLVLAATLRTIKYSLENQIEIEAAGGIDMSDYAPIYKRLDDKINSIEKSLGIKREEDTTPGNYLQNILNSISTISNKSGKDKFKDMF
jgi:hypothetical protein